MDEFNKSTKNSITIEFDQAIYTLKAIKRAISDFSERANSTIENISQGTIRVLIFPIQNKSFNPADIERDFERLVFDNQINIEVEEDFRDIRNIIVAQAFFPCDNIEKIVDKLDHEGNI
ncbi:MAG: hypothetical protein Q7U10_08685 [Thermodesulfovibrionia bacterium]|nr:hypothetical protein [Thermodesulfovibrionia bacterium]